LQRQRNENNKQKRMKNIKTLAVAGGLVLGVCAFAFAHGHLGGARGHGARSQHTDFGSAVEQIAEAFPNFAAFDANKDGQFDAAEMESVGRAMADGRLYLPAHMPPSGVEPGGEAILAHIGEMYARFARYDANHDGALDATEQSAIKTAIEKGELTCPMGGSRPHH
jgi:EF hand